MKNKVNTSNLEIILESSYNAAMSELKGTLLESGGTDFDLLAGQRFITESVLTLRNLMIEEGIVQNVKDNLLGYAGAAGLGAMGMKYYNDTHQPNVYEQAKQGVVDVGNGIKTDLAPVFDKINGVFRDPVSGETVQPPVDQAGLAHVSGITESTSIGEGGQARLNIWEEAISIVLPNILENTSESLKAKTIARLIIENGSINLEEANFICNLVDQVITESMDEFIPDEIEVEDMPEDPASAIGEMELFDADGNKYIFSNGQLMPADADGMVDAGDITDPDQVPMDGAPVDEVPAEEGAPVDEVPAEEGAPVDEVPAEEGAPVDEVPAEDPTAADGIIEPEVEAEEDPKHEAEEDPKAEKKEHVEESTTLVGDALIGAQPEPTQLLTESSDIVSRILAKMQY